MQQDTDHIHWLMIERLTGEISDADELYLSELLDNDPGVKEAYRVLRDQFAQADLDTKFARLKSPENWRPMPALENGRNRVVRLRIVRLVAVAAVLTGILSTAYLLINSDKPSLKNGGGAVAKDATKGIKLQIAGGKTVDLSISTGQVNVGNGAVLNSNDDSLFYVAGGDDPLSTAVNTLTIPAGRDYKVVLSDGTLIWLNSSTILKFPFNFLTNEREISIQGEAYLEVAKDTRRPFVVYTEHGSVKVLGTQFNINTYDPQTLRVSLVEGAVQVNADEKRITLKPGEEAEYEAQHGKLEIQEFDEEEILSWRQGIHHFYNNTIQEVCEIFPRWYGMRIVIDNKNIYSNRFTGVLNRNEPIEKFLRALKATSSVNGYEFKNGELHLK